MKGSVKQIAWAEDIKSNLVESAQQVLGKNAALDKIVNAILSIDNAVFWIEYREYSLQQLVQSICKAGLRNKGNEYSNVIKADHKDGSVVESWTEIIQDGKGGHYETKTKTW